VNIPEIPAQDARNYSDQDAERAWIAKYRLALESAASLQPAQNRGIRAVVRRTGKFLASTFDRLLRSFQHRRSPHMKIAAKRPVPSTKTSQLQVEVVDPADAKTAPAKKAS
jgi:hypothetical protein